VDGVLVPDAGWSGQSLSDWDPADFLNKLAQAKMAKDYTTLKALLKQVAESNYQLRRHWQVPRTVPISHKECLAHRHKVQKSTRISFSTMSTADALLHFAKQRGVHACALNFANGETAGGGYKNGSSAQEEDLCRRMPTLYSSLHQATKDGLYPYGPCTCRSESLPEKYADVLYTSDLVVARYGEESGFAFLPGSRHPRVSLVSAAAPNCKFKSEVSTPDLIYKAVQSIFIAPQVAQPEVNTLILGAWGCGAFGGDPAMISELFVQALVRDNLGQLYKEVHFAIPRTSPSDRNYDTFLDHFKNYKWKVHEVK
jgi:uncharacterized protein (TIGR02452 family)